MSEAGSFQRTRISPIDCLTRAGQVMGDQYMLFVGLGLVFYLIQSVVPLVLLGPLMCGYLLCFFMRMRGQAASFETLFKGFDYFLESFLVTLLVTLLSLVVMVPFLVLLLGGMAIGAAAGEEAGPPIIMLSFVLAFAVYTVSYLILIALASFMFPLVVDRQMKAMDAFRTGISAAWAHLGSLMMLSLLNMVILTAAFSCCIVPGFFVLPYSIGALAVAYRQVFPDQTFMAKPLPPPYDA